MRSFWLVASVALTLILSGCAHQMQIQQGIVFQASQIAELQVGMSQDQVTYILGTPNLVDPYHPNSWYYIYTNQESHQPMTERKLVVNFDANQKVLNWQES